MKVGRQLCVQPRFASRGHEPFPPKDRAMIHYTCDRCKRSLSGDDLRYVVKLEVYASMDPQEGIDDEGDRDHLLELHEILERVDDCENEMLGDDIYQARRFDLCTDCHRKFLKAPLGRETLTVDFSNN
jgi:hypothetical protein